MADVRVRVANAAAVTNRDGRAQLGVAAAYLQRAYALVPDLTNLAGVQDQARDMLDRVNAYAQGIYATIPDDDEPLSDVTRARVLVALSQADENLALVQSVDAELHVEWIAELLDVIPAGVAAIGAAAVGAAADHWIMTLFVVAAIVVVVLNWRRLP